jgi:hypothetical protein
VRGVLIGFEFIQKAREATILPFFWLDPAPRLIPDETWRNPSRNEVRT